MARSIWQLCRWPPHVGQPPRERSRGARRQARQSAHHSTATDTIETLFRRLNSSYIGAQFSEADVRESKKADMMADPSAAIRCPLLRSETCPLSDEEGSTTEVMYWEFRWVYQYSL